MTPILFLDIDGVLVTLRHIQVIKARGGNSHSGTKARFDPECVGLFNELLRRADPDIVISSSWRIIVELPEIRSHFEAEGIVAARIIGATTHGKRLEGSTLYTAERRGLEIADYLRESNHQGPFCILDDDSDMAHLKPFLVQTTWATGLQPEHVERAVKMMKGEL